MARRRHKKRTHLGGHNVSSSVIPPCSSASRTPKSMVIRAGAGLVGSGVSQLVKDVRKMMGPGTASRLKERRSNKLRDYTTMAGPLGVSHLLIFSKSPKGNTNLRIALIPRGPTLHFRVEAYSLCKDVQKFLRHSKGGEKEYLSPPLLVMNNFTSPDVDIANRHSVPRHLENLSTTIFQSLFPPIVPHSMPLSSIRRVLLLNRESSRSTSKLGKTEGTHYTVNLRHYAIVTKRTGLSRGVRQLGAGGRALTKQGHKKVIPNLGNLEDVADFINDPLAAGSGFSSGSESEVETGDEVELLGTSQEKRSNAKQEGLPRREDFTNRYGEVGMHKRAVKLVEMGPRMKLRLMKVEEAVCGGKVMWHQYLSKSEADCRKLDEAWESRKRERAERKRVQQENVDRKREPKASEKDNASGTYEASANDDLDSGDEIWDSEESGTEG
ncbi:MAG: hypothetical protein Q9219_007173 [cf. Caloplaca sp. 3 TL-2023]